jgi:hypothetical protein
MKTGFALLPRQSGAISSGLVALAGFAAGALVVGLLALNQHPAPIVDKSIPAPMARGASEANWEPAAAPQADPPTWPFESGTPAPARPPGAGRPDRLSAPDGWTYEQSAAH